MQQTNAAFQILDRLVNSPQADANLLLYVANAYAQLQQGAKLETVLSKLVKLARALGAKLFTNDYNLGKIAELQSVPYVNLHELARAMKPAILPGETFNLRIAREGKDKGQGIGYLNDGTMVVVNHAQHFVGQQIEIQVQSLVQTGAGVLVFADVKTPVAA